MANKSTNVFDTNTKQWLENIKSNKHIDNIDIIYKACKLHIDNNNSKHNINLEIANTLIDLEMDTDTIAASIILEQYQSRAINKKEIQIVMGEHISKLLKSLSKLSMLDKLTATKTNQPEQIATFHKMILTMLDDPRVIIIKLAEQIHILKNLIKTNKNSIIFAKRAMALYVPLANQLALGQLKPQLEDLAFRILEPKIFETIKTKLKSTKDQRDKVINKTIKDIKNNFLKLNIHNFDINGRIKHVHSIYKKMKRKNTSFDNIFDVNAIRILVPSIKDCYTALSSIHESWKYISDEFDDYIAHPKPNGYQSLHTAINVQSNTTCEIQIRTKKMHEESEYGLAAHSKYKSGKHDIDEEKVQWLRNILRWKEYITKTTLDPKNQSKENRVYVFTPLGDVFNLSAGSTPIDFAYRIHTDVGHRCNGAKLQGKIISLTYKLKTGDQIEILTSKYPNPNRDWLISAKGYIKGSRARNKISQWFNQKEVLSHKADGRKLIDNYTSKHNIKDLNVDMAAKKLKYKSTDDLLVALARNELPVTTIINVNKITKVKRHEEPLIKPSKSSFKINYHNIKNVLYKFAKCCNPEPGDQIIGYISVSHGLYIHKAKCRNILKKEKTQLDRVINVDWENEKIMSQKISIEIKAFYNENILNNITSLLLGHSINILSIQSNNTSDYMIDINATIIVPNTLNINDILKKIQSLKKVTFVKKL